VAPAIWLPDLLDLFGVHGRQLLANLVLPELWQSTIEASVRLIDELGRGITGRRPPRRRCSEF
jgi:hypothetical protein